MVIKKYTFQSIHHMRKRILKAASIHDNHLPAIHIIAKYEVLCSILNDIVKHSDYSITNVKINDFRIDGYLDEYILSIADGKIWCQEARNKSGYIVVDGLMTFVHSDCSSRFVTVNKRQLMYEFEFSDEKER